jgi:hypothetical protein
MGSQFFPALNSGDNFIFFDNGAGAQVAPDASSPAHFLEARFWVASGWSTISGVIPCGPKRNTECGQVPRSHEQISGCLHEACRTLFYRRQLVNCVSCVILAAGFQQPKSTRRLGVDSHLIDSMMQQFGSINPRTGFSLRFT